ncbi:calcium channel flower isoform X1 [Nasonia vitripennis]|uniref:Calcium channel flower n=1 Tax=Nasonia vitripennis TaxID=7425 RepID=A0A7M7PWF2_NASVI|nr:calcium channel flower isoform X1 [Nasonia vitripennis]
MSFSEKFASIMARPGQDPQAKDDVPWWMKYGGRILGIVGGFLAIFLGVWNCVSILLANVSCFLSGLTQMIAGFIVLTIEAPCCCMFIDFVQNFSEWVDKRPYWNRAAAYCLMAIPPFLLCIGATSFFGSGLIFATGVVYGMMSIGKKASIDEMRNAAGTDSHVMTATRSNLVENAQPMGLSARPDSNV